MDYHLHNYKVSSIWMSYLILTEADIKNYSLGGHSQALQRKKTQGSKTYRTLNKQKENSRAVSKLLGGTM